MKQTFPFLLVLSFFICSTAEVVFQDLSDVPINLEPLWSTQSNISAGRLGWYELTAMGTLVVASDTPLDEASISGSNLEASKISGPDFMVDEDSGRLFYFKMKKADAFDARSNSMMGRAIEILCYQL